jgi:hypothetical protein
MEEGRQVKGEWGRGEFKHDTLDPLQEPVSMPQCTLTQHNNKEKKLIKNF